MPKKLFQPGVSGNPKGRPKGTYGLKAILMRELDKRAKTKDGKLSKETYKDIVVKTLMEHALVSKDTKILMFLWEQLDGKAQQNIDLTSDDEKIEAVRVEIVTPKKQ